MTTEKKPTVPVITTTATATITSQLITVPSVPEPFQMPDIIPPPLNEDEKYWSKYGSSKVKVEADEWDSSSKSFNSSHRSSKYEDDYEYDRYSKSKYDKYDQGKERERDYSRYHREDEYERGRHRRGGGGERERDRRDYRREERSTRKDKEFFEYPRESRENNKYESRYGSKNYSRSSSSSTDYYGYSSNYPSGTSYDRNYPPYPSSSSTAASNNWIPLPPKEDLSQPRPPPEPADLSSSQPPPPVEDDEDQIGKNDEEVDLDTRIAMIFDTKAFGDDNNSNRGEEAKIKEENDSSDTGDLQNKLKKQLKIEENSQDGRDEIDAMEEGELNEESTSGGSSIASPFETRATYRNNKKFLKTRRRKRSRENKTKVESGASDISSSEDELIAKGSYSPPLPRSLVAKIKAEDEMSLSSLSSTEHPIKEELEVADEFKNFDPSAYMYQHMPGGLSSYQNYYYQFQQPHMQQWNYDAAYGYGYKNEDGKTDDPHEVAVKKVIEKLIQELKQILKKDFNKRMIENTAFKKYEAWWDDQERNKNTRITHETETPVSSSIPLNPLARDPLSETTYHPAGPGSSLGMLRNIRFQRIKRETVPTPIQENSRKSDNEDEDVVHGSDSEKEDLAPTSSYINKRKISDSSSSDSSESDISSSEDEEDEEEKDDHAYSSDTASLMSEDELVSVKKTSHAKKEKENNRIYSDSDSDQEINLPKTTAIATTSTKAKLKIYSDSEDDEEEVLPIEKKKIEIREKTPEGKTTPVHPPVESDSDFFNDDVISKPPRTPGRSSSDDQQTEKVKSTPVKPTSLTLPKIVEEKKDFNDRMYSDSEEERDYQERIRRNTEWMEQIEREAKEEMEKQKLIKSQQPQKDVKMTSTDTSRAASPIIERKRYDEPFTPTSTSLPPITPGADLSTKTITQDLLDASGNKKKRGRPKGSLGKIKEPKEKESKESKKIKNGAISKIVEFAQPQNLKPEHEQKYSLKLSPSSSSDGGSSQASLVAMEHCYSLPPSASPSTSSSPNQEVAQAVRHLDHDHGYYGKSEVTPLQSIQPTQLEEHAKKDIGGNSSRPVGRPRKDPNAPKAQYTKKGEKASEKQVVKVVEKIKKVDPILHQQMIDDFVPVPRYTKRPHNEEFDVLCRFLTQGIDQEDVDYMKRAYTYLIQNDIPGTELLHQVHWVDHCASDRIFDQASLPKKRRRGEDFPELRKHATGCARTEGFYKIDSKEKAAYKYHHLKGTVAGSHLDKARIAKMQNASREARSNQRRLLTAFAGATESDLLKFNQLKFRKKQLKFAKSAIHDWGLFAMEPIAADEMVIEYVGQMVRPSIADLRETKYEAIGIGSSYLFRIDLETIIDATKCGNLARFINHSCNVSNFILFLNIFTYFYLFFIAKLLRKSNHD